MKETKKDRRRPLKRKKNEITVDCLSKLLQNKSLLTVLVDEQGQVLSVVRADVEQQSRTLVGPEAQGDVLSSQRRVRVDGGRQSAAVPAQLVRLLEGVAD